MPMLYDAERLKKLRIDRGWSREELAKRASLTTRALSNLERPVSEPKANTLARLSLALGVRLEAFFKKNGAAA